MIKKLIKLDVFQFVYWNFVSKKVIRDKHCYLIPYKHAKIELGKGSIVELHGNLEVNERKVAHSKAEAYLLLRDNARLVIGNGVTRLVYKSTIELHDKALVEIGQGFFNVGSVLLAGRHIKIGSGVVIAREVYIYDKDGHEVLDENGKRTNLDKPVIIGDHVWVGLKSIILKGSKIGDGAVVSAGSTVRGELAGGWLAGGCPAKSISPIRWR